MWPWCSGQRQWLPFEVSLLVPAQHQSRRMCSTHLSCRSRTTGRLGRQLHKAAFGNRRREAFLTKQHFTQKYQRQKGVFANWKRRRGRERWCTISPCGTPYSSDTMVGLLFQKKICTDYKISKENTKTKQLQIYLAKRKIDICCFGLLSSVV